MRSAYPVFISRGDQATPWGKDAASQRGTRAMGMTLSATRGAIEAMKGDKITEADYGHCLRAETIKGTQLSLFSVSNEVPF